MTVEVRLANSRDLPQLAELFDAYRQFYGRENDIGGATAFLAERLQHGDSTILTAHAGDDLIGFTQLYPSFSSTRMRRTFILNDLFVAPSGRRIGVGRALLAAAADYAADEGAFALTLSTALDNLTAQRLYEENGWTRDAQFCVYHKLLA